jgi:Icc-related predicted phosphoesterase
MKLLLFSDVHCSEALCKELVRKSDSADIVIGAGDFGLVRKGLIETIDILKDIQKPCVLVPGNSESFEELESACKDWKTAHVIHGSGVDILGKTFFGIGGGIPVTPFGDWSVDYTEDQARQMLLNCTEGNILVTHSPPKGALDISSTGQNFGSQAVREVILEKKPVLCVCGHIHESGGKSATLGNTPVVNAGPNGMFWKID